MKLSIILKKSSAALFIALLFTKQVHALTDTGESLTLSKALELAYQSNPRMVEARNNIASARGKRLKESTLADPEVEFEIGGLRKEDGERDPGLKQFAVRQDFDPPAALWLKSRIARNEIASQEEALKGVWAGVYREVRNAYYTILLREKELEVAEDNLKVLRRFLDRVALRFQAGEVLRNDLQRAKIEVLEGENLFLETDKGLQIAKAAFNLLIGRDIGKKHVLIDAPEYKELKGTLNELLDIALRRRPDLAEATIELDSKDKTLSKEKLSILPAPFVAFEREMEDYDDDYKIILGFAIPFWNWNVGEIKRARAERDLAENNLFALTREVSYEVYNAFLEATLADKQVSIAKKALAEANELLRLADLRYGEGEISYLDYIDQVKTVMETRLRYNKSLFNFNQSVTKLEQATYASMRNEDYLK